MSFSTWKVCFASNNILHFYFRNGTDRNLQRCYFFIDNEQLKSNMQCLIFHILQSLPKFFSPEISLCKTHELMDAARSKLQECTFQTRAASRRCSAAGGRITKYAARHKIKTQTIRGIILCLTPPFLLSSRSRSTIAWISSE